MVFFSAADSFPSAESMWETSRTPEQRNTQHKGQVVEDNVDMTITAVVQQMGFSSSVCACSEERPFRRISS